MMGSFDSHKINKYRKLITLPVESRRYESETLIEKEEIKVNGFQFRRKHKQKMKTISSLSYEQTNIDASLKDSSNHKNIKIKQIPNNKKKKIDTLISEFEGRIQNIDLAEEEDEQSESESQYCQRVKQISSRLMSIYLIRIAKQKIKFSISAIMQWSYAKSMDQNRRERVEKMVSCSRKNLLDVNKLFASRN